MRLVTLEIKGFKSFPEKTTINFNDSITGVVGPNGCGKSTLLQIVCDSVCPPTVYNVRIVQMDQEVNPELHSVMQLLPVGRSATSGSQVDAPLSR